jgi:hypothetical protein
MQRTFETEPDGALNKLCPAALEVSPDGSHGLYYSESFALRILDFESDTVREVPHRRSYRHARFTPDGKSILLWRAEEATLISLDGKARWTRDIPLPRDNASSYRPARFTDDGSRVLLPLYVRGSAVLDLKTGAPLHVHDARSGMVVGITSAGDRLLARRFASDTLHFIHL